MIEIEAHMYVPTEVWRSSYFVLFSRAGRIPARLRTYKPDDSLNVGHSFISGEFLLCYTRKLLATIQFNYTKLKTISVLYFFK